MDSPIHGLLKEFLGEDLGNHCLNHARRLTRQTEPSAVICLLIALGEMKAQIDVLTNETSNLKEKMGIVANALPIWGPDSVDQPQPLDL